MTKSKKIDDPIVIELGDNLIAWISEVDAEIVGRGWTVKKAGYAPNWHYYAIDRQNIAGERIDVMLHNEIWERFSGAAVPRGFLVDHINGDKMDCRRSNLRLATRAENEANKGKRRGKTTSKYKGVNRSQTAKQRPWRAMITVRGKQVPLGFYADEWEAAQAYNKAAVEIYGEFAFENEFIENIVPKKEEEK